MIKENKFNLVSAAKKGGATVLVFLVLQNLISFFSQLIMARLISPDAFGLVALAMLVGMFFQVVFNSQGDKYIIQSKDDNTKKSLNVIISLELILAIAFMILVSLSANYIEALLGNEDIAFIVQLLTISYLATPFQKIRAFFEKDLLMMKSKLSLFLGQVLGGILGVVLALNDFGVYAIVIWRISTPIIDAIILIFMLKFNIRFQLDKIVLKKIYSFSWPIIFSSILIYFIYNVDYYIVGHFEDYETLGYYWLAFQVSHYFLSAKTAINSVLFPTFAKVESLKEKISLFNGIIKITTIIYTIPAVIFLIYGNELVIFLYGEKWSQSVIPIQIFFITVTIKAIGGNAGPFFYSIGKTKQDFTLALLNSISLLVIVSILTYYYGIIGAALGVLISSTINSFYGFIKYVSPITKYSLFFYFGKITILFSSILIFVWIRNLFFELNDLIIFFVNVIFVSLIYGITFKSDLRFLKDLLIKNFKMKK